MTYNFSVFRNLKGLILILIVAILLSVVLIAYFNGQVLANDKKRIEDIEQIQAALKIYFDENGFYPASNKGVPKDIETYLSFWPTAPSENGGCTPQENTYNYVQRQGTDYWVTFCLGKGYDNLGAGNHRASSKGIE